MPAECRRNGTACSAAFGAFVKGVGSGKARLPPSLPSPPYIISGEAYIKGIARYTQPKSDKCLFPLLCVCFAACLSFRMPNAEVYGVPISYLLSTPRRI